MALPDPDDHLALSITKPDGSVKRWGPDEPDAQDVPDDLAYSSSIPGGHKECDCSLLRRIDLEYSDQGLFDDVRVYGAGNRTRWEGRQKSFPRSHGAGWSIKPRAVGWVAHLTDDTSFRAVIVDRDYARWMNPTLARRAAVAAVIDMGRIQAAAGQGLTWDIPNEALATSTASELMYDAGPGLPIARLEYQGTRSGTFTGFEAATIFTSDNENLSGSATAALTLDNTLRSATLTAARYAMLRASVSAGPVTPPVGTQQRYTKVALYGDHGIPARDITGDPSGVYTTDVIAYILAEAAPLLTVGEMEEPEFAIPHLIFPDAITAEDAILQTNVFSLYEWGVYDNREFFYRAPDPERMCWEARLSSGAELDLEGDDAEGVFNGVFVTYTRPDGRNLSVGPPGGNFDTTNAALEDTSPTNPVNAHGIPRRWARLDLSFPTTEAGATAIGVAYLAEKARATRRGRLTLTRWVDHPTEGRTTVQRIRAGDYIRIGDHPADVPRRIIQADYTHANRQATLTLDNTSQKLDAIMERVGVRLVDVF